MKLREIADFAIESLYLMSRRLVSKKWRIRVFGFFVKPMRVWRSLLNNVGGVVHVGAHNGQERLIYDLYDLEVIWIEADPEIYAQLVKNIKKYPKQKAIQALMLDRANEPHKFRISSNQGHSSSIYTLNLHSKLWPTISMSREIYLSSKTLDEVMSSSSMTAETRLLVLDTQGSELLVLIGAEKTLSNFNYVLVECADFEAYSNGTTYSEISDYLLTRGYCEVNSEDFAEMVKVGKYMNVLFAQKDSN